jgi:hypothetical protein
MFCVKSEDFCTTAFFRLSCIFFFCRVQCVMSADKKVRKTLEARRFFLTIPKCQIGKKKLEALLKDEEEFLSHYIIGEEKHVDGTKHHHIYLKYSKKRNFSYSHFDYLGKHGKLEVCRSPIGSYMYISKEDKAPLSNFDYEAGVLKGTTDQIALYLSQTGKKYEDLFRGEGAYALATKWRALKVFEREMADQKKIQEMRETKRGIKLIDEDLIREKLTIEECRLVEENEELKVIIEHINNVIKYKWKRPFKTKNLLIYSDEPNTGKTSLIRKLGEHCPIFHFPRGEWFHGYKNQTFWGMLWNETDVKGWKMEDLKNMLEGTAVTLEVKGGHIDKDDNPEVFMTSNYTLYDMVEERYKYDEKRLRVTLKTLRARIDEVNLNNFVQKGNGNIFFLQKLIVPIE